LEEPTDIPEPTDAPPDDDEVEVEVEQRPRPSRRTLTLLVAPIVVLAIVGTVTTALTPALAAKHPLLLILLEARNRNLILARRVDFWPFLLVATLRRTLTDPLYFLLGRYYGEGAVRWLEVKAGLGSYAQLMEKVFKKASHPAVFLFPGAVVCALAGVVGMRFGVFIALNVAGTITAVLALKVFGDAVADPVEDIIAFFDRNLITTTAISIVLVVLSVWLGRVQGKADLSVREAEEELAREIEADREGPEG
jgi:membrane protein DedA with SNARE-associated domain